MTTNNYLPSIDGIWVHLEDGENPVDIYVSNFFWRQAVFVKNNKISQRTALSKHRFQFGGASYEVKFKYTTMTEGECQLYKNGELIDADNFALCTQETASDFKKLIVFHAIFAMGLGVLALSLMKGLSNFMISL
ncbi:hypothetical protein [Pleionea sp. CnH1-48]|uniref:hypothetical protein n=1 Tax=Pleionea sp. CnH1-48 TaxID=2954494 RepID=UPI002096ED80|nr:hypothetical protein [Pleionea sp. CnH1-48]MCO7223314.1 hypothetical protein [Pleionea sp. CnH1-48]